ncbi:MAG: DUF2459 domain-containing protein, partial [Sphingopyxis sp.]|nr:DUF2459 domain-containing protein [Sphingopyxis sp.]
MSIKLPMKLFAINSVGTLARALIGWSLLLIGFYMLAALVGGMIPRNADWRETPGGTTIWLHDNGIHTSIIIPCQPPSDNPLDADLNRCIFPHGSAQMAIGAVRYQMIGWGDRDFYLNTPQWRDVRFGTVITALLGSGQSLLHIEQLDRLPQSGVRAIRVSANAFDSIVYQINDQLMGDATVYGTSDVPLPIPGYGANDAFY